MSAWTQAVYSYLTGASSSRFRHQQVTILEQWSGRDNLLWRARSGDVADAVVKMFTDAGQARSRRQFSGQEQFTADGLAPEPLWYDRYPHGLPRQILVYRWAEGEALRLSNRRHRTALAEAAARIHCADRDAIQQISPRPFNLLTFWQIWQAGEVPLRRWLSGLSAPLLSDLLSTLWAEAHRTLDTALPLLGETPPAPIHGDLSAENALYHRGRVLLIDWEFFGLGDPALEIARFLFYCGDDWPPDAQEEWWESYRLGNPDPSLPNRVDLYMRLFNFQAVTFLMEGIRQGGATNAQGNGRPAAASEDSSASALDLPQAEAASPPSDAVAAANGPTAQYRAFLITALTVAVRRSLEMWKLPPLGKADGALLANELEDTMNFRLAEPSLSGSIGN